MENEATTPEVAEVEAQAPEFTVTAIENDTENTDQTYEADVAAPVAETEAVEGESLSETAPEEDVEEEEEDFYQPQQFVPQGIDLSSLPADEAGNVDPEAFTQAMASFQQQTFVAAQQAAMQQMSEVRQEEKLWQKAIKEYPALETNKDLRKLVMQTRVGAVIEGKNATPLEAARSIFKHIEGARSTGQRQATESVRVQQSAALVESSSVQSSPKAAASSDLMERVKSRNKEEATAARQELFEQMLQSGALKTK